MSSLVKTIMKLMQSYSSPRIGAKQALKLGFKPNDVQKAAQKMWEKQLKRSRGKVTPKSKISNQPEPEELRRSMMPEAEVDALIKIAQRRFKTKNPTEEQIEIIWRGLGKKNYFNW